jgi:hypothetical protein
LGTGLAPDAGEMNAKISREPVNPWVDPVIIRVNYVYKLVRYDLGPILVFRCGQKLIHGGLFVKQLAVEPLEVPNVLEEFMRQWTILDEKYTRVQSLKISTNK